MCFTLENIVQKYKKYIGNCFQAPGPLGPRRAPPPWGLPCQHRPAVSQHSCHADTGGWMQEGTAVSELTRELDRTTKQTGRQLPNRKMGKTYEQTTYRAEAPKANQHIKKCSKHWSLEKY